MSTTTQVLRPLEKEFPQIYQVLTVLVGSLVIATCAQLQIPLWFTPVPISFATFGVMLVGATLGPVRGALAVLCYLAEGVVGLPVFAGGAFGLAKLLGPTGGYLVGYIAVAAASGIAVSWGCAKNYWTCWIAMFVVSMLFFVFGLPWLALFVGKSNVIATGFTPFLVGGILKTSVLASYLIARERLWQ